MDFGNEQDHEHAEPLRRPRGHVLSSAIVSGDSDQDDDHSEAEYFGDGDGDIFEQVGGRPAEEDTESLLRYNSGDSAHVDELYDQNLDEEDEAYVYKHMRSGIQETMMVRNKSSNSEQPDSEESESRLMKVLKPRNSDAVLSCPCCFNIVCMDCQRHQRYRNQFRAMFVMGITVDWQSKLMYDEDRQILVPKPHHLPNEVPPDSIHVMYDNVETTKDVIQFKEGEYFPVLCRNCQTQVASLDMMEEIYHFHGCLESS